MSFHSLSSLSVVGETFEFEISLPRVPHSGVRLLSGIDFVISAAPGVNSAQVFCHIQLPGCGWGFGGEKGATASAAALIASSAVTHQM